MKPNYNRTPTHVITNDFREEKLPSSATLDMLQGDLSSYLAFTGLCPKANVVAFAIANKPHSCNLLAFVHPLF